MAVKKKKQRYSSLIALPNYKRLFSELSSEDFLNYIFNSRFIRRMSQKWDCSYDHLAIKFDKTRRYFHTEDIYEYFRINHLLNHDVPKDKYERTLFSTISDIYKQVPDEVFTSLNRELVASPQYVRAYSMVKEVSPQNIQLLLDLLEGYDVLTLRKDYGYDQIYLPRKLKEIYQQDLTPIDISQESFN